MECPSCGEEVCQGPPICGLKYIARSPKQKHGGFHENAVETAKQALRLIEHYEERLAFLGNALNPQCPPFIAPMRDIAWDALEWRVREFPAGTERVTKWHCKAREERKGEAV